MTGRGATDDDRVARLAEVFIAARNDNEALGPLPDDLAPRSAAEAEAVDDRVAAVSAWPVVGWKIGCTSAHAQKLLRTDGPFAGRIYSRFDSGVSLGPDTLLAEPHLEGEFAFSIGADLAPSSEHDTRRRVVDAIADAHPAIEIVGGRFADFLGTPVLSLMADAGANSHLIVGPAADSWDPDTLAATAAMMTVDGTLTGKGTGADVLGGPIEALVWLVEHLSARGITLEAGHIVTTGTATQVSDLPVDSTAIATLDGLGSVSLSRHS